MELTTQINHLNVETGTEKELTISVNFFEEERSFDHWCPSELEVVEILFNGVNIINKLSDDFIEVLEQQVNEKLIEEGQI